jgi:hypothetical protein
MMREIEEERWPARSMPVPGRGIAARIAGLAEAVSRDPVLLRRGRTLDTICQLNIGDAMFLLRIVDANIIELRHGPFVTPSADFAISGDELVWQRFLAAAPPPGDHDLFAFVKRRELVVTGDLHPLMSHLLYFKELFGCLRAGEVSRCPGR